MEHVLIMYSVRYIHVHVITLQCRLFCVVPCFVIHVHVRKMQKEGRKKQARSNKQQSCMFITQACWDFPQVLRISGDNVPHHSLLFIVHRYS